MINLSEILPTKHTLLKLDCNPYLLENQSYFFKRLITVNSAKFTEAIFKKYNHQCPVCLDSLHNGEKIELHQMVKEVGKYSLDNIKPLHQICHISITHNKVN